MRLYRGMFCLSYLRFLAKKYLNNGEHSGNSGFVSS